MHGELDQVRRVAPRGKSGSEAGAKSSSASTMTDEHVSCRHVVSTQLSLCSQIKGVTKFLGKDCMGRVLKIRESEAVAVTVFRHVRVG